MSKLKFKIQSKSSITYVNLVKEFKSRNTEFHIRKRETLKLFLNGSIIECR